MLSKSCEPTEIDQLNSRRYQEMPLKRPRDYWMSFVKLKPGAKSPIAESQFQTLIDRCAKEDPNYTQRRKAQIVTLNQEVLGRF